MTLSHRYEDFGTSQFNPAAALSLPQDGLDELKLDSFEDGYKAGWDDAVKAHVTDRERAVTEVAQRLQDISFTYEEAFVKLAGAMQPLMAKIAVSLLPDVAQKALAPQILEQLKDLLTEGADNLLEIAVAPDTLIPLQEQLEGRINVPISLTAEPLLSAGQVFLRVAGKEREINLDAVQAGISTALDAFFDQTQEEKRNG